MWIGGLLRRRPLRVVGAGLGVALAVMIVVALGSFFASSKARMTSSAITAVPVDWQVQLSSGTNTASAAKQISAAPGVSATQTVSFGDTTGLKASNGGTTQTTGPGKIVGIPDGYANTFPKEFRYLVGARTGVLIAQQAAANLHAAVGSPVTIGLPGGGSATVRVGGVIDLPAADSLFQTIGVPPGSAPSAPPDNVIVVPDSTWHRIYDPVAAANPNSTTTQVHVQLNPSTLPTDPGAAFSSVLSRAKNLEAQMAGAGQIGNNLAAQLDGARGDAIYAQLLFLFLGLPGAILAALLTIVIGAAGAERRRNEQALLRTRGATRRKILSAAFAETAVVGVAGTVAGLAGALLAGRLAFGTTGIGSSPLQTGSWLAIAIATGLGLAAIAILLPAWRDVRNLSVSESRAEIGAARRPLWMRLYLDFLLLGAAGLVYWQVVKSGYQVVLAPEGVPTLSVSYVSFLAPLFLWIGSALLAWRIANTVLRRGRKAIARVTRPLAHGLSGLVAASMSRQRRLLSRGLMVMALTASFAVSTSVFNSTFVAQAQVDAQLTNGADVAASTTATGGLPAQAAAQVSKLPGVAAVQPLQHRFAYVGNDLQDLYGINPVTIGQVTPMSNAFFGNGSASQTLAQLAARPDAVLVSDETVKDFQLQPGDLLRLRMQFASDGAYHVVPFHYVGIVREFPTAPHDSFFVANASYVAQATGSAAPQTLLIKTTAPPPQVAAEVRRVLGPSSGVTVTDIATVQKQTLSSLTAIDLSGLTRLELAFAFVLAASASGLVLGLGLVERRRTFAIASALGAKTRQLAAFVWSEAAFVTAGGLALGIIGGWLLAFVIVKILTGVFDPPPEHLFIPWAYLAMLAAVTLTAVLAAVGGMMRATKKPAVRMVRDL